MNVSDEEEASVKNAKAPNDVVKHFTANKANQINIISDIKINDAVKNATRNLFADKNNVVTEEFSVQENQVSRGLCFICGNKITSTCKSYACLSCNRTYHHMCIQKYDPFNALADDAFQCKTCKKTEIYLSS